MKKLGVFTLLMLNLTAFSQHNVGVKLHMGLSIITDAYTWPKNSHKNQFAPSAYTGIYYDFNIGDKSVIGSEILFIQIEGKSKFEFDLFDDERNYLGQYISNNRFHSSYIGIPVYYSIKRNKLKISIGVQGSLLLYSTGRSQSKNIQNGNIIDKSDVKIGGLFDKYDLGLRAGFGYKLSDELSIEGNCYYGLNRIMEIGRQYMNWQNNQFTIGLKYSLWKSP